MSFHTLSTCWKEEPSTGETRNMKIAPRVLIGILALPLLAPAQTPVDEPMPRASDFPINVRNVLAPTTVTDKNGDFIAGLQPSDFTLFDNDRPQRLNVDVSYRPISLVIAVQDNNMMNDVLPQIQRMGNVLEALVIGDAGEAAVIAFDHRIRVMQDFTSDSGKITDALKKITPGSSSHRMIDASMEAIRMLRSRAPERRRVLLLFSETRDGSSEGRIREVLREAQLNNVLVYTVDISHVMTELTGKAIPPRPDPIPAEAQHVPGYAPQTPTAIDTNTRDLGNWLNIIPEIFTAAKYKIVDNPATVLTQYTGGRQYSFVKQKTLERDLSQLGEELHSQYMLSYAPNDLNQGGFHHIRVEVDRAGLVVRTRPGYWVGPEAQ